MHTWAHIWKSLCGRVHFDMLSSCPTCNEVWERFSHSSPSPPFLSLCLSSFHITFISFHHRLTAPQYLFIYLGLWEKKRVKLSLWGGGANKLSCILETIHAGETVFGTCSVRCSSVLLMLVQTQGMRQQSPNALMQLANRVWSRKPL